MRKKIIIGILTICALGGSLAFANQHSIFKDTQLIDFNINKAGEMVCYIDGKNKVFLNNIDDSVKIEDSWDYNVAKTINISADMSQLDPNSMFLEVDIPVGLKYMASPESFLGKVLTSVDKTEYQQDSFDISSGNNVGKKYISNSGKLRFTIDPSIKALNLDFLIGIDDALWDGRSSSATYSEKEAIRVSVGDKDSLKTQKVDSININKINYSPRYWSGTNNSFSTQGVSRRFGETHLFSNQIRLFKNLTIELEKPHIKKNVDGEEVKEYLPITNIVGNKNGTFSETDTSVIFSWDNLFEDRISMDFFMNPSKETTSHKDVAEWKFKEARITGILSNETYVTYKDHVEKTTIVSDDDEYIEFTGQSHGAYKAPEQNPNLYNFGRLNLKNHGGLSNRKRLKVEFPTSGIGVKTFRMPTPKEQSEYLVNIDLFDKSTNSVISTTLELNKKADSAHNKGYLLTVANIANDCNLDIKDLSNVYIKSIEYDIGSLPSGYTSGCLEPWHTDDSGNAYGVVFRDNANATHQTKYTLVDLDDSSIDDLVTTVSTNVTDNTHVTARLSSFDIIDAENKPIREVVAGNNFSLKGNLYVPSYAYDSSVHMTEPVYHIKVPKQISINENLTKFEIVNSSGTQSLKFSVINKDSPRVLSDGMVVYDIKLDMQDYTIGYYSETLGELGYLRFNINLNIPKNVRSTTININKTLFIADKYLNTGGYSDSSDIDGDGNTSEKFVSTENLYMSIISNTEWLDVDNSGDTNGSISDETSNASVLFGFSIDNSNEGIVRVGNFEYFIPVPKKGLNYNKYIKDPGETFNFDMELTRQLDDMPGYNIEYTYDNSSFFNYKSSIDLSKVSMIKVTNTKDIEPNEKISFNAELKYVDDSWDGTDNDNIWSIYGTQIYEKNGLESSFLHVLDKFNLELIFKPFIINNPQALNVFSGNNASFSIDLDLGIPHASGRWQEKKLNNSNWVDLSETSTVLNLENIAYSMNGNQYRYVATNKGGEAESTPATLTVIDNDGPIIEFDEFKEGDDYKITVVTTDNGSGVSHIILPDGTRVDSDTHTLTVEPNTMYTFKAYDLAGNESSRSTQIGVLIPKTATSNLDLYIKSENMLSLSLDTNSVSFDNFSGAEDVEKQNAINLTVSSSLPYKVNASLQSEIQNSDKSKTMDKSMLNIKANSDATYKTFSDILNTVTILDDQSNGNNITHGIDLKLKGNIAHEKDVYKTTIKIEVEQK